MGMQPHHTPTFNAALAASISPTDPSTNPTAKISPFGEYANARPGTGSGRALIISLLRIDQMRSALSEPHVANSSRMGCGARPQNSPRLWLHPMRMSVWCSLGLPGICTKQKRRTVFTGVCCKRGAKRVEDDGCECDSKQGDS